jgi:hypothetical protein
VISQTHAVHRLASLLRTYISNLEDGVTKHYVMGMEVVLANGDRVRYGGKTMKNVTA